MGQSIRITLSLSPQINECVLPFGARLSGSSVSPSGCQMAAATAREPLHADGCQLLMLMGR